MSLQPIAPLALTLLAIIACTPTHTSAPSNPPTASVATQVSTAPTGARAKRAPPQPGEPISPVIAFRGTGNDWHLQIENADGHAHDGDLTWRDGSQASGTLQYKGPSGAAVDTPILLVGTLDTKSGRRTMRVEITPVACTHGTDQSYTHSVQVTIQGLAPMHGCGDLAK